jgi:hypothetical protein
VYASPKAIGQWTGPLAEYGCATTLQRSLNRARATAVLRCVVATAPARVGSTVSMVRRMVTVVAWLTLAQPTAGAVCAACTEAGVVATVEPHPATAAHSSAATAIPRSWREDIMLL